MARDFLTDIVEHKMKEVAEAQRRVPEEELKEKLFSPVQRRSLAAALSRPGINIIAEIKRASPSRGAIRPDLDPSTFAAAYEKGGAAAISVLTDTAWFNGSADDLTAARQAATLPVLRKEFILTPYQVYESAVMGADAILLIVRILTEAQLNRLLALARELNLEALVEIHAASEVDAVKRAGAGLVGNNNRNLQSFETDTGTAVRILDLLDPGQVAVAASGIGSRSDIEANLKAGIHNFLVGESIVRAEDTAGFIRTLIAGDAVPAPGAGGNTETSANG